MPERLRQLIDALAGTRVNDLFDDAFATFPNNAGSIQGLDKQRANVRQCNVTAGLLDVASVGQTRRPARSRSLRSPSQCLSSR